MVCAWCGTSLGSPAAGSGGRARCAACGAATTYPWPSDQELARAYARYRPASGRFSGPGDALLRGTRSALAARIDRVAPPGPVLDVGAGDGTLLDALRARGREAVGLEREPQRPDILEGGVEETNGGWAAVVFWHSLEHLPAPGRALEAVAQRLQRGGVVLVAMPNAASLQAAAFGDRWLHLDVPRHLVHVPADALVARLRELGLRVTRISHWRGGQILFGWLHGLVGLLPGNPDLYDTIRRPEARSRHLAAGDRALAIAAGCALFPVAALAAAVEIALRRGGSVYVEARRD